MAHRDYEEFLAAFEARAVRYLIGGAHALALHARPRATKDLDVFISPTLVNARRASAAIADFFGGAAPPYTDPPSLLDPKAIVQIGVAPVRIDILPRLGAVRFADAWKRRVDARFGRVPSHYLSLEDLIEEKSYWGRDQDKADLRVLERARSRKRRR